MPHDEVTHNKQPTIEDLQKRLENLEFQTSAKFAVLLEVLNLSNDQILDFVNASQRRAEEISRKYRPVH